VSRPIPVIADAVMRCGTAPPNGNSLQVRNLQDVDFSRCGTKPTPKMLVTANLPESACRAVVVALKFGMHLLTAAGRGHNI
jgi:hypothetical protein